MIVNVTLASNTLGEESLIVLVDTTAIDLHSAYTTHGLLQDFLPQTHTFPVAEHDLEVAHHQDIVDGRAVRVVPAGVSVSARPDDVHTLHREGTRIGVKIGTGLQDVMGDTMTALQGRRPGVPGHLWA